MNITLEEQIEYMREEVLQWRECYGLQPATDICQAILATLEAVMEERKRKHGCHDVDEFYREDST